MNRIPVLILMRCDRKVAEGMLEIIGVKARFHHGDLPSTCAAFPLVIMPISAVDDYFDPLDYDDYSDFDYTKYCAKRDLKQLMQPPFALAACYCTLEELEQLSEIADAKGHMQPRIWYWNQWVNANSVRTLKMHAIHQ